MTMDITHVRTCTANLNCDYVPNEQLFGMDDGREARCLNMHSQNCSHNHGDRTASELSHCEGTSFPEKNMDELYRISLANSTETRTPDGHCLQIEYDKAVGTSQKESTSDSVSAKAKRSNSLKFQSGKPGHAQAQWLMKKNKCSAKSGHKSRCSAEAVEKRGNQTQGVKKSGNHLATTTKQLKEKKQPSTDPSELSTKVSSSDLVVKKSGHQLPPNPKLERGKKGPLKDPSNSSVKMGSSDQVEIKCSVEAVKSGNQTEAVKSGNHISSPNLEKEKKGPSKDKYNLSRKMSSSDQVRWVQTGQDGKHSAEAVKNSRNQTLTVKKSGNQLPPTAKQIRREQTQAKVKNGNRLSVAPKQVWRVKEKTELSQGGSGKTSFEVHEARTKASTSSPKKSSFLSKRQHKRPKSISPRHHIKWDDFVKLGHNCYLCGNDLGYSPIPINEELESIKLPDVAVLPCGHAIHILCLEQAMPENQSKDPPCFLCASLQ